MIEKPYGKFTLEQCKQLTNLVHESRNLSSILETVFREADPTKLKSIIGDDFSWSHFYEMPFIEHITSGVFILDWQDNLKLAVQSEDPQQYFFDFFNSLDDDEDWNGGYQGLFEKSHLVALVISIVKSMKSIMIFQKSLSTLIEDVRIGDDTALFNAVRIDRTIVACQPVRHRISMAEMQGDNKFFLHLKSALKGPSRKQMVALEEMRYMMQALVETGADRLNGENLEQLFVEHLKLYPRTPGAQKNLIKHYTSTKKINHRK